MTNDQTCLVCHSSDGTVPRPEEAVASRPLDILIVTSEAPPIVSGISTCIGRLATGLAGRGHHVRVLSSVQIPRLTWGEWRLSSFLAYWPRIARTLRHFDVVNVHGPVPTMSDAFLKLAGGLPPYARPVIVYTHHSAIELKGAMHMSALYNRVHESLALRADRVVTSSQYYADQHHSRYGPLVRTIPWGVEIPVETMLRSRAETRRSEKLRVLFVGQMRSYKGVETLLAAVAGEDWLELTLVGRGARLASYQQLADRLKVTNARFTGWLSDAELAREYQSNDVIVLPSVTRAEAFGLVLLEGMAAGCVPVASDLPGVRDIAATTGLVVPAGNAQELRGALRALAADSDWLARLQKASLGIAQQLSWERCVTAYEEVMLDAVRSRYARLSGRAALPDVGNWPASRGLPGMAVYPQ